MTTCRETSPFGSASVEVTGLGHDMSMAGQGVTADSLQLTADSEKRGSEDRAIRWHLRARRARVEPSDGTCEDAERGVQ
jgi:hypothetical protein